MHQSIPAAPIPPLGNCGAFARIVSPGGQALAYPRATPGLLTHTWFLTQNPNVDNFIGKDQQFVIDWLVRQGLDQIGQVFKGMFPRFQAFSHCLSSYNLSYHVYTLKHDQERSL